MSVCCDCPFIRGDDVADLLAQLVYLVEFIQHELRVQMRPLAFESRLGCGQGGSCPCDSRLGFYDGRFQFGDVLLSCFHISNSPANNRIQPMRVTPSVRFRGSRP